MRSLFHAWVITVATALLALVAGGALLAAPLIVARALWGLVR
jgi:hypothetical protein